MVLNPGISGVGFSKKCFSGRISLIFETQYFTEEIWGVLGLTFLFPPPWADLGFALLAVTLLQHLWDL